MSVWLFSVSGIVGSGKSTAMKRLKKSAFLAHQLEEQWPQSGGPLPSIVFVQEPVKLWREKGWLQRYYSNPDLYALAFQSLVFCTHVNAVEECIRQNPSPLVIIMERSMYDQLLFWYQQKEMGKMTADAMHDDAYMMMWHLRHRFIPQPAGLFFFYTKDIQHTMQRVKRRARAEEMGVSSSASSSEAGSLNSSRTGLLASRDGGEEEIQEVNGLTLEYQTKLLERHLAWFTEPSAAPPHSPVEGVPCMHVLADEPYHENDGTLHELAARMAAFICKNVVLN